MKCLLTGTVIQVQSESAEIGGETPGPGSLSLGGADVTVVLLPGGLGGLRASNLKGGWLLCS